MIDSLQPPTDNLYKFLAIGGLAFTLVAFVILVREQARLRERYIDADVELKVHGYVEGSGAPTDLELRRAYFRREAAHWEVKELFKVGSSWIGTIFVVVSPTIAAAGFIGWYRRVQRYDDAILRATAAKLLREEAAAARTNPGTA